jgi:hypothetical protein
VETQVGSFDDSGERWRSRPALSALVSVGVFVVPTAAAIGSADVVARLVSKPTAVSLLVGWWAFVLGSSTLVLVVVERLTRRRAGGHRTRR